MPYLRFFILLGIICLIYPPMLGFVYGVAVFCTGWYIFYRLFGGT